MTFQDLPFLNALLNAISSVFLIIGYIRIKQDKKSLHKRFMIAALVTSGLFLISYLVYHAEVGSVPYPYYDWTRPLYFTILIPHIILAGGMSPFIIIAVWHAFHQNYQKHRLIVRWIWPVWMYVSVSGVIIYLLLYQI